MRMSVFARTDEMVYNGAMVTAKMHACTISACLRKTLSWTLPILLLVISVSCSSKEEPQAADSQIQTAETSKPEPQPQTLLTIGENTFDSRDFERFLEMKYSSIDNLTDASEHLERLKSRIFDAFVENALLLNAARIEGISVSETEAASYMADLKVDTAHQKESDRKDEVLIQKFLFNRVYKDVDVDIKECQDFYKKNRQQFKKNKQIMLHQILLKDEKRAFEIKEILDSEPSRFEEFALSESKSIDAQKNGFLGYFEQGQLPQEIEKYAFALKKNEISQVVKSPYGYHIFRVSQIRPSHSLYFNSVSDEIKKTLLSEKLRQAYTDFMVELKKKHPPVIHYENLPFKYVSNEYGGDNDTVQ